MAEGNNKQTQPTQEIEAEVTTQEPIQQNQQDEQQLRLLEHNRDQIIAQVNRLKENLKRGPRVSALQIQVERVSTVFDKFDEVQTQIERINGQQENGNVIREAFETLYYETIGEAVEMIQEVERRTNQQERQLKDETMHEVHEVNVRLPALQLPTFEGDYRNWLMFRDAFEANISSRRGLTDSQKFQYLRGQLNGQAALVIQNLDSGKETYETAWQLLKNTYEDKSLLTNLHLKALFELNPITKASSSNLRTFIDNLNSHIRSLEKLESKVDHWGHLILTHMVVNKLDFVTKRDWERTLESNTQEKSSTVDELIDFLTKRCKTLMREENDKGSTVKVNIKPKGITSKNITMAATTIGCDVCKGDHKIYFCPEFLKLSQEDRRQKVRILQLCLNCLGKGHIATNCKGSKCRKCDKQHNTLLHVNRDIQSTPATQQQSETEPEQAIQTTHGINHQHSYVLLATAVVLVKDYQGKYHEGRVLLDPGSQASYVTQDFANKLRLPNETISETIVGITSTTMQVTKQTTIHFKSRTTDHEGILQCLNLPRITQQLPNFPLKLHQFKLPRDIQLADPGFHKPSDIHILMGADIVWSLLGSQQVKLNRNQPLLQETLLGWIVSGPLAVNSNYPNTIRSCLSVNLDKQVQRFWQQEELEETQKCTEEENNCEAHFKKTYARKPDGRFIVALPKRDQVQLGKSFDRANTRLHQLERRFRNDQELKDDYVDFMNEYKTLNHMSEVSLTSKDDPNTYYIPHQPVVRTDAITTKLRVVFDASASTSNGKSLNDLLLSGPTIQQDVTTIIIRFRIHQFVMNADIEKMYRQIEVAPADQTLQRICWRPEENQDVKTYQLTTVTYGTTCAPFLATRCLKQLAIDEGEQYPLAKEVLLTDFYMDDLLTGSHTRQETIELRRQLIELLQKGKFKLRKWRFNDKELFNKNKESNSADPLHILENSEATKTLGMLWNHHDDTFTFVPPIKDQLSQTITKRFILSTIARLFDPLGLVAPLIMNAKLILQQLWEQELSWDDQVPPQIITVWKKFVQSLDGINNIKIPRNINPGNISTHVVIHAFCDASPQGYGTCIYALSENSNGRKTSRLICAKTRVAPKAKLTLPRLELNGALLLTRLVTKVKDALANRISEFNAWTDSKIVLAWIASNPEKHQVYVANRIQEIKQHEFLNWRYIPSEQNPADLLTRQSYHQPLQEAQLWWTGPEFLTDTQVPEQPQEVEFDREVLEVRKTVSLVATEPQATSILYRYSSFRKLRRVIATCRRWKLKHDKRAPEGPLTVEELQIAENQIIALLQTECLSNEIRQLQANRQVDPKSKLYALNPYLDTNKLIRITGRLTHSDFPWEVKNPLVLPKHFVSELIVRKIHQDAGHCGTEQLLSEIRQKFWPTFTKRLIKKVIKSCYQCYKVKPNPMQYQMGQLPKDRVRVPTRPFASTGLDYAGPIMLKERRNKGHQKLYKGYIALFICMATKAVHLEVVTELTTEAFLACLTRFTARRGLCRTLHSDNATTFIGANNQLQELYNFLSQNSDYLTEELAERGISWKFIPPRAPHFGGIWEANVKSAKRHLAKITQGIVLTFEEFITLITSIEACLNSRPLTPISNDPSDLQALTPAHFLIGDSLLMPLEHDYAILPSNRLSRWQHIQQLRQHFWHRWQREYLHQLQTKAKWHKPYPNIKTGDMVLLIEDNVPPLKWTLGRVMELHPGQDKTVRVVTVKTRAGVFKRAVTRLSLLPCSDVDTQADGVNRSAT